MQINCPPSREPGLAPVTPMTQSEGEPGTEDEMWRMQEETLRL